MTGGGVESSSDPAPFNRRTLLSVAACAAAGLTINPVSAIASSPASAGSLQALARRSGRNFGSAIGLAGSGFDDARNRDLIAAECGLLVCANEMKPYAIARDPQRLNFDAADTVVAFARRKGMKLRGHTLVWAHPKWLPKWLRGYTFPDAATARGHIFDYVRAVGRRYRRHIVSWDVVNEAIAIGGNQRATPFHAALGPNALDHFFLAARAALPKAELVYNDYMNWSPVSGAHRAGVLRFLEGLRRRNVPCDALGIQSHLGALGDAASIGNAFDETAWRRFLDDVVAMGYRLVVTELDVHDRGFPATQPLRDVEMAAYLRAYLDLMLSYPETGDIVAWGLSDRYSWLATPQFGGSEHSRPALYDRDLAPKPMRDAVAAAFANAARAARY